MTPPINHSTCYKDDKIARFKGVNFRAKNDPGQEAHRDPETIVYDVFQGRAVGRVFTHRDPCGLGPVPQVGTVLAPLPSSAMRTFDKEFASFIIIIASDKQILSQ
jgi:hypothetical protein